MLKTTSNYVNLRGMQQCQGVAHCQITDHGLENTGLEARTFYYSGLVLEIPEGTARMRC
jgi:hypothetical protein